MNKIIFYFLIPLIILLLPTITIITIKAINIHDIEPGDYLNYKIEQFIIISGKEREKSETYIKIIATLDGYEIIRTNLKDEGTESDKIENIFLISKNDIKDHLLIHPLTGPGKLEESGGLLIDKLFSTSGGFIHNYKIEKEYMISISDIFNSPPPGIFGSPIYNDIMLNYGETKDHFVLTKIHLAILIVGVIFNNTDTIMKTIEKLDKIISFINYMTGSRLDLIKIYNTYNPDNDDTIEIILRANLLSTTLILRPHIPYYIGVGLPYAITVTSIIVIIGILTNRLRRS
jgi:hypothetical protein